MNDDWVQVLLPVHNEAGTIEAVVREIYKEIAPRLYMQFLICEDGSTDGTKEILLRLRTDLPMQLVSGSDRKGYSRAVIDGMKALQAPYLLCIDSDGQCDPADFWQFWERRHQADVLLGWRIKREDVVLRRFLSRLFKLFYKFLFQVHYRDPSCPYLLIQRPVLDKLLSELGTLDQGFWWEFIARAHRHGFIIGELPVRHRRRFAGVTQVYQLRKLPRIGYSHLLGLIRIWRDTRC